LEESGLRLCDSVDIVHSLQCSLNNGGTNTSVASEKMKEVFNKNPGWKTMVALTHALTGSAATLPNAMTTEQTLCFVYAPITSTDVERSFSEYKSFFRKTRTCFTPDHLKQHLVVLYNRKRC
jgi:hypothetical protein